MKTIEVHEPWWKHPVRLRCKCGMVLGSRQIRTAGGIETWSECDECKTLIKFIDGAVNG